MTSTLIGGHQRQPTQDGPGVHVFREDGGVVVKKAYTLPDVDGLRNEARFLRELEGTGVAPRLYTCQVAPSEGCLYAISQEDLGESQPVQNGEDFRRHMARLLWTLHKHGVRHGDATSGNIIIRDDKPMLVDFQQSNYYSEGPPQKRPLADSYFLWRFVAGTPAIEHPVADTPRVVRRWLAVLGELGGLAPNNPLQGKTLLDLGCFQGDFCAMAAADGMWAHGVDTGGFNSEIDSIREANRLWGPMGGIPRGQPGCSFQKTNLVTRPRFDHDVVLLFSTWPYIVRDYGRQVALDLLQSIMSECGVLFFETQLAGDGPGPDFLVTDDDVANMLGEFGTPQPLVTIPVTGRAASRTVWKVIK